MLILKIFKLPAAVLKIFKLPATMLKIFKLPNLPAFKTYRYRD